MTAHSPSAGEGRWGRLPALLRPLERGAPGKGRLWLIETVALVLVGLLLSVATGNDVVRQTHINERLIADLSAWRQYTGHHYHNVSVDQEVFGPSSHRDVVCGNTSPGAPKATTQLCLVVSSAGAGGRRTVTGGWYLPKHVEDDVLSLRYACFGRGAVGQCPP
jgi:hypothetical protein